METPWHSGTSPPWFPSRLWLRPSAESRHPVARGSARSPAVCRPRFLRMRSLRERFLPRCRRRAPSPLLPKVGPAAALSAAALQPSEPRRDDSFARRGRRNDVGLGLRRSAGLHLDGHRCSICGRCLVALRPRHGRRNHPLSTGLLADDLIADRNRLGNFHAVFLHDSHALKRSGGSLGLARLNRRGRVCRGERFACVRQHRQCLIHLPMIPDGRCVCSLPGRRRLDDLCLCGCHDVLFQRQYDRNRRRLCHCRVDRWVLPLWCVAFIAWSGFSRLTLALDELRLSNILRLSRIAEGFLMGPEFIPELHQGLGVSERLPGPFVGGLGTLRAGHQSLDRRRHSHVANRNRYVAHTQIPQVVVKTIRTE